MPTPPLCGGFFVAKPANQLTKRLRNKGNNWGQKRWKTDHNFHFHPNPHFPQAVEPVGCSMLSSLRGLDSPTL